MARPQISDVELAWDFFEPSVFYSPSALPPAAAAIAADRDEAEKLFRTGRYDECLRLVDDEIASDGWNEPLRQLKIKACSSGASIPRHWPRSKRRSRDFRRAFRSICWAVTCIVATATIATRLENSGRSTG